MGDEGDSGVGSMGFGDPGMSAAIGADNASFGFDPNMDSLNMFQTLDDPSSLNSPINDDESAAMANAITDNESGFGKFSKSLQSFLTNQAIGKALGPMSGVVGLAGKGAQGPAAFGGGFMGALGGMAGGALGGPMGAMAGSALGNSLGGIFGGVDNAGLNGQGPANASAAVGAGMGGAGWGDMMTGLAGMYMGNRSANQYNSTINSLNDLYSPNSPYAQQMRQNLERKDAAAGRRSQYGPREAQLMAALANQHAQTLSSPGYANLMQQRNISQNQGLNTLLAMNRSMGNPVGNGINGMMRGGGMDALMNNGYSSNWAMGPNAGPQMPDMGGSFGGGGNEGTWYGDFS